jgi:hypothetical protein
MLRDLDFELITVVKERITGIQVIRTKMPLPDPGKVLCMDKASRNYQKENKNTPHSRLFHFSKVGK